VAIYASIALVSLLALCWCCLPHCIGVFAQHRSCCDVVVVPGLIVINCVSKRCRLWWSPLALHWHCLPFGAGIFAIIALASSPLPCWCLPARNLVVACSIVVVLRGLVAIHAACNLVTTCGIVVALALFFVHGLVPVHGIVVVVCGSRPRPAMPPATAADGLGLGNA
jgi:hypothetical protein